MKLEDMRPGMEDIDLMVRVVQLTEPQIVESNTGIKYRMVEGLVEDDTGKMEITVWDDKIREELAGIEEGDSVFLKRAFITSFKGKLSVNIGRDSEIINLESGGRDV
jgi:replication factor A1